MAWDLGDFATGFKSSFIVAATVDDRLGGALDRHRLRVRDDAFRGDRWVFSLLLLGIIFPYEATVIPLYYDFQSVGLLNTYWALILPQVGQSVSFGTFWMRAFFRSSPRSLIEAARIDGASSFGVLRRVLLPQARPAITTMGALVFVYTWNEFLLALVLIQDPARQTAPLGLSFFAGTARAGDPTPSRRPRCSSRFPSSSSTSSSSGTSSGACWRELSRNRWHASRSPTWAAAPPAPPAPWPPSSRPGRTSTARRSC